MKQNRFCVEEGKIFSRLVSQEVWREVSRKLYSIKSFQGRHGDGKSVYNRRWWLIWKYLEYSLGLFRHRETRATFFFQLSLFSWAWRAKETSWSILRSAAKIINKSYLAKGKAWDLFGEKHKDISMTICHWTQKFRRSRK